MGKRSIILSVIIFLTVFALSSCTITGSAGSVSEDSISDENLQNEQPKDSNTDQEKAESGYSDEAVDGFSDLIRVTAPSSDQLITSPLVIKGEARGTWFFEATFPVKLLDANGNMLVEHYAQTEEEWMTEDFISFTARIEFDSPGTDAGTLLLIKSNPSDIREYDAQIEIPVRFK